MNKFDLIFFKILTNSMGSFELLKKLFFYLLEENKRFKLHQILPFFLKSFLLERKSFGKRKIFFFLAFLLFSQQNFFCLPQKNLFTVSLFFFIKNIWGTKLFSNYFWNSFFPILFSSSPNGVSLNHSVLFILFSFWTKRFFMENMKNDGKMIFFLIRIQKDILENDIITHFFLKNFGNVFKNHEEFNFYQKIKINRFLTGSLTRKFIHLHLNSIKHWLKIIKNLKFNDISRELILKLHNLNKKKNKAKNSLNNLLRFINNNKKKLGKNLYQDRIKSGTLSSLKNNFFWINGFRKNRNLCKFFFFFESMKIFFFKGKGLNIQVKKILSQKRKFTRKKFLIVEIDIFEKKTIEKITFCKQRKLKNVIRIAKNFFFEIISDSCFKKEKKKEKFLNWVFKLSTNSIVNINKLKILGLVFFQKQKSFFFFFKEFSFYFMKFFSIFSASPNKFGFLSFKNNFFWKSLSEIFKFLDFLFLNFKVEFSNFKNRKDLFLKYFSGNDIFDFFKFSENWNEKRLIESVKKIGLSYDYLDQSIIFKVKKLFFFHQKKKKKKFYKRFSNSFLFSFFFWEELKIQDFFLLHFLFLFIFQLFKKTKKKNFRPILIKWVDNSINFFGKKKKESIWRKIGRYLIGPRVDIWLEKIKSLWCNFFWYREFSSFFFFIRNILKSLFLFLVRKVENRCFKFLRNWIIKANLCSNKKTLFCKNFSTVKKNPIFKIIFHLNYIS